MIKNVHSINTRKAIAGDIFTPFTNTTKYGLNSIYRKSIDTWNHFTKYFKDKNLSDLSKNECKELITELSLIHTHNTIIILFFVFYKIV